jgi:hypothetical protein
MLNNYLEIYFCNPLAHKYWTRWSSCTWFLNLQHLEKKNNKFYFVWKKEIVCDQYVQLQYASFSFFHLNDITKYILPIKISTFSAEKGTRNAALKSMIQLAAVMTYRWDIKVPPQYACFLYIASLKCKNYLNF